MAAHDGEQAVVFAIGSLNPTKVEGARVALQQYFPKVEVIGVDVSSGTRPAYGGKRRAPRHRGIEATL